MFKFCILICLVIHSLAVELAACTTFVLKQAPQLWVGKSYDWVVEDGLVIVNKRHIVKKAMTLDMPMKWVSRYGSVIFTQAGRELPMGGMNEAGLVVEIMALPDTVYPAPDERATVYELQWIQYQLDTASCTEEVITSDCSLRIDDKSKSRVHFLVADKAGHYAVIEFLDGRMVVHRDGEMKAPVLANHSYQNSVKFLNMHKGFGGERTVAEGFASLDRYTRIATRLLEFSQSGAKADRAAVFSLLSSVVKFGEVVGEITEDNFAGLINSQWNLVYDITSREIHFLTAQHQKIRTIRLNSFEFEGNTPVEVLDMQAKLEGDVCKDFIPYTYEINRCLIDRYYDKIPFLKTISTLSREYTARYPETTYYQFLEVENKEVVAEAA